MELRKDYLLDRWVIISEGRGKRPREFKKEEVKPLLEKDNLCYFCEGNEHLTPAEIYRAEKNGKWKVRVFPNKFPATQTEGMSEIKTDNDFFTFSNAYGKHEVIADLPEHNRQIFDLSEDELFVLLDTYTKRLTELSKPKESKYVVLFKNHGKDGGTSIMHSHTQIVSLNFIPTLVREEVLAAKQWAEKHNMQCPYCKILDIEKGSFRRCFENKTFVAFTPYASRYNYEIWLFPKKHYKNITELSSDELKDMAVIFRQILAKLKDLNCSFNFFLHYSPKGDDLHFHFEFTPRISTFAGFEIGTDAVIDSITPEDAAKFYRGE